MWKPRASAIVSSSLMRLAILPLLGWLLFLDLAATQHPSISCEEFYTLATATGHPYRVGHFVEPNGRPLPVSVYRTTVLNERSTSVFRLLSVARANNNHPPLFFLVVRVLLDFGLDAEMALRIPAVTAHLAATYLLYVLILEFRSRTVALAGAAVFSLLPEIHFYAHEGRAYTLLLALAIAATIVFVRVLRDRTCVLYRVTYVALLVAGGLTHYLFTLLVLVHILVALLPCARPALRSLMLVYAAAIVCLAPWFLWAASYQVGNRARHLAWLSGSTGATPLAMLRSLGRLLAAPELGVFGIVGLLVAVSLAAVGVWGARRDLPFVTLMIGGILVTPASLLCVDFSLGTQSVSIGRYWLLVTPFWAMAAAAGLASIRSRAVRFAVCAVWMIVLAANMQGILSGRISRSPDDHQRLAAFVEHAARSVGDPVIVEGNVGVSLALGYYARAISSIVFICNTDGVDGRTAAGVASERLTSSGQRLLIQTGRGPLSDALEAKDIGLRPLAEFGHVMVFQILDTEPGASPTRGRLVPGRDRGAGQRGHPKRT